MLCLGIGCALALAALWLRHCERIVRHLKGTPDDCKLFRHFVKKTQFKLLDLPAAGLRDVLVVAVKEDKRVSVLLGLVMTQANHLVLKS